MIDGIWRRASLCWQWRSFDSADGRGRKQPTLVGMVKSMLYGSNVTPPTAITLLLYTILVLTMFLLPPSSNRGHNIIVNDGKKSIVFTLHVGPYARISTGPSKICSFIHPPDGLSKNQHLTTLLRHGYGGLDGRRTRFKCRPHPDPTRLPKLRREDHNHTIERRMTPSTLK